MATAQGKQWAVSIKVNARALASITNSASRLTDAANALTRVGQQIRTVIRSADAGLDAMSKNLADRIAAVSQVATSVEQKVNAMGRRAGGVMVPGGPTPAGVLGGLGIRGVVGERGGWDYGLLSRKLGISRDVAEYWAGKSTAGNPKGGLFAVSPKGNMDANMVLANALKAHVTHPLDAIRAVLEQVRGQLQNGISTTVSHPQSGLTPQQPIATQAAPDPTRVAQIEAWATRSAYETPLYFAHQGRARAQANKGEAPDAGQASVWLAQAKREEQEARARADRASREAAAAASALGLKQREIERRSQEAALQAQQSYLLNPPQQRDSSVQKLIAERWHQFYETLNGQMRDALANGKMQFESLAPDDAARVSLDAPRAVGENGNVVTLGDRVSTRQGRRPAAQLSRLEQLEAALSQLKLANAAPQDWIKWAGEAGRNGLEGLGGDTVAMVEALREFDPTKPLPKKIRAPFQLRQQRAAMSLSLDMLGQGADLGDEYSGIYGTLTNSRTQLSKAQLDQIQKQIAEAIAAQISQVRHSQREIAGSTDFDSGQHVGLAGVSQYTMGSVLQALRTGQIPYTGIAEDDRKAIGKYLGKNSEAGQRALELGFAPGNMPMGKIIQYDPEGKSKFITTALQAHAEFEALKRTAGGQSLPAGAAGPVADVASTAGQTNLFTNSLTALTSVAREHNAWLQKIFVQLGGKTEKGQPMPASVVPPPGGSNPSILPGVRWGQARQRALELEDQARKQGPSVGQQFANYIPRVGLWGGSAMLVYGAFNQVKQSVATMAEYEAALARVGRLLNPLGGDLRYLGDEAATLGQKYGHSVLEVVQSMEIFAQQGRKMGDIIKMTDASLLLSNVGALSAAQATEALVSAQEEFGISTANSMRIVDSWSEIQRNAAVSVNTLAEATKVAGTTAREVGVDFDTFNGIIAAVSEATRRGGGEIGNSVKAIFESMRSDKAIQAFQAVGITVTDMQGKFRDTKSLLAELSDKWTSMSDGQKQRVASAVAGPRRINDFLTMMNTWQRAEDVAATSMVSQGSAMRQNQIEMATLTRQVDSLKAAWDALLVSVGKSGMLDMLKQAVQTAGALVNGVGKVNNLFGGAPGKALGTAAVLGAGYGMMRFAGVMQEAGPIILNKARGGRQYSTRDQARIQAIEEQVGQTLTDEQISKVLRSWKPPAGPPAGGHGPEAAMLAPASGLRGMAGRIWTGYKPQAAGTAAVLASGLLEQGFGTPEGQTPTTGSLLADTGSNLLGNVGTALMLTGGKGKLGKFALIAALASSGYSAYQKWTAHGSATNQTNIEGGNLAALSSRLGSAQGGVRDYMQAIREGRGSDIEALTDIQDAMATYGGGVNRAAPVNMESLGQMQGRLGQVADDVRRRQAAVARSHAVQSIDSADANKAAKELADLIAKRDKLIGGKASEGELAANDAEISKRRAVLYENILQPLRGLAKLSGSSGSSMGMSAADITGYATKMQVNPQELIFDLIKQSTGQDAKKFATSRGMTAEQVWDQGYYQRTTNGPVRSIAGNEIVANDQKVIAEFIKKMPTLQATGPQGAFIITPEQIDRLVSDFDKAIDRLVKTNERLIKTNEFVGQTMGQAAGLRTPGGLAAAGMGRQMAEMSLRTLVDIQDRGRQGVGAPIEFGGVANPQEQLLTAIGELVQVSESNKPVGLSALISAQTTALKVQANMLDYVRENFQDVIKRISEPGGIATGTSMEMLNKLVGTEQNQAWLADVIARLGEKRGTADFAPMAEAVQRQIVARSGAKLGEFTQKTPEQILGVLSQIGKQVTDTVTESGHEFRALRLGRPGYTMAQYRTERAGPTLELLGQLEGFLRAGVKGIQEQIAAETSKGPKADQHQIEQWQQSLQPATATLDLLTRSLAEFNTRVYDVDQGMVDFGRHMDYVTRVAGMGELFGQHGNAGDRLAIAILEQQRDALVRLPRELRTDKTAEAVKRLGEEIEGRRTAIQTVEQSRSFARQGLMSSVLTDTFAGRLGLPGGNVARGYLHSQTEAMQETLGNIARVAGPLLQGKDWNQQWGFTSQINQAWHGPMSDLRKLQLASDTSFSTSYMLASPQSQAIADSIQHALSNGASMQQLLANPYTRDAVRNDPLLQQMVAHGAEQDFLKKAIEFDATSTQRNTEATDALTKSIDALVELFRQNGITRTREQVKEALTNPIPPKLDHEAPVKPGLSSGTMAKAGTQAVDSTGRIRQDDTPAILHKGEIVLNRHQSEAFLRNKFEVGTLPPGLSKRDPFAAQQAMFKVLMARYGLGDLPPGAAGVKMLEEAKANLAKWSGWGVSEERMAVLIGKANIGLRDLEGAHRHPAAAESHAWGKNSPPKINMVHTVGIGNDLAATKRLFDATAAHELTHTVFGAVPWGRKKEIDTLLFNTLLKSDSPLVRNARDFVLNAEHTPGTTLGEHLLANPKLIHAAIGRQAASEMLAWTVHQARGGGRDLPPELRALMPGIVGLAEAKLDYGNPYARRHATGAWRGIQDTLEASPPTGTGHEVLPPIPLEPGGSPVVMPTPEAPAKAVKPRGPWRDLPVSQTPRPGPWRERMSDWYYDRFIEWKGTPKAGMQGWYNGQRMVLRQRGGRLVWDPMVSPVQAAGQAVAEQSGPIYRFQHPNAQRILEARKAFGRGPVEIPGQVGPYYSSQWPVPANTQVGPRIRRSGLAYDLADPTTAVQGIMQNRAAQRAIRQGMLTRTGLPAYGMRPAGEVLGVPEEMVQLSRVGRLERLGDWLNRPFQTEGWMQSRTRSFLSWANSEGATRRWAEMGIGGRAGRQMQFLNAAGDWESFGRTQQWRPRVLLGNGRFVEGRPGWVDVNEVGGRWRPLERYQGTTMGRKLASLFGGGRTTYSALDAVRGMPRPSGGAAGTAIHWADLLKREPGAGIAAEAGAVSRMSRLGRLGRFGVAAAPMAAWMASDYAIGQDASGKYNAENWGLGHGTVDFYAHTGGTMLKGVGEAYMPYLAKDVARLGGWAAGKVGLAGTSRAMGTLGKGLGKVGKGLMLWEVAGRTVQAGSWALAQTGLVNKESGELYSDIAGNITEAPVRGVVGLGKGAIGLVHATVNAARGKGFDSSWLDGWKQGANQLGLLDDELKREGSGWGTRKFMQFAALVGKPELLEEFASTQRDDAIRSTAWAVEDMLNMPLFWMGGNESRKKLQELLGQGKAGTAEKPADLVDTLNRQIEQLEGNPARKTAGTIGGITDQIAAFEKLNKEYFTGTGVALPDENQAAIKKARLLHAQAIKQLAEFKDLRSRVATGNDKDGWKAHNGILLTGKQPKNRDEVIELLKTSPKLADVYGVGMALNSLGPDLLKKMQGEGAEAVWPRIVDLAKNSGVDLPANALDDQMKTAWVGMAQALPFKTTVMDLWNELVPGGGKTAKEMMVAFKILHTGQDPYKRGSGALQGKVRGLLNQPVVQGRVAAAQKQAELGQEGGDLSPMASLMGADFTFRTAAEKAGEWVNGHANWLIQHGNLRATSKDLLARTKVEYHDGDTGEVIRKIVAEMQTPWEQYQNELHTVWADHGAFQELYGPLSDAWSQLPAGMQKSWVTRKKLDARKPLVSILGFDPANPILKIDDLLASQSAISDWLAGADDQAGVFDNAATMGGRLAATRRELRKRHVVKKPKITMQWLTGEDGKPLMDKAGNVRYSRVLTTDAGEHLVGNDVQAGINAIAAHNRLAQYNPGPGFIADMQKSLAGRPLKDISEFDSRLKAVAPRLDLTGLLGKYELMTSLKAKPGDAASAAQTAINKQELLEDILTHNKYLDEKFFDDLLAMKKEQERKTQSQAAKVAGITDDKDAFGRKGYQLKLNAQGQEYWEEPTPTVTRHFGGPLPAGEFRARDGEFQSGRQVYTQDHLAKLAQQMEEIKTMLAAEAGRWDPMRVDAQQFMGQSNPTPANSQVTHGGSINLNLGDGVQQLLTQLVQMVQSQSGSQVQVKVGAIIPQAMAG